MSFFKRIFGNVKGETPDHEDFKEGDIFYTRKKEKYQTFKLLKIDNELNTFHVKAFEETSSIPTMDEIVNYKVKIHHFPVDRDGFNQPKFITNNRVNEDDLLGYFEYIKQTHNINEIIKYAKGFYQQAYELTNQKNHIGAIEKYSKAIELMPGFYEAIDNRAFCFMDLGRWNEAIEGFKQSLQINPNSLLAVFSIGECYLRLKEYQKARSYFENAVQIDPTNPKPKEFLTIVNELIDQ